ncbi:MAG: hypothetical protein BMS9Abin31_1088 [Gammaproteobacteria bacterium]|nr:MAG: hypothetical protein BMS9Abin31_1088 [Gammaproteobacteria bacterium]
MAAIPEKEEQIRQSHAVLIHQVVHACQNETAKVQLKPMLDMATQQNWHELVSAINKIVAGQRGEDLLNNLDDEDKIIIKSILQGLQNPASLPEVNQQADPTMAAPGLASMINAASRGDTQALQAASLMADQMTNTQGDMRQLGGIMKRLIDGERDPDTLTKKMSANGKQLVMQLLDELNKLALQ